MHDDELTTLLERAREDVSPAASTIAGRLAADVAVQRLGRRWTSRSLARKGILVPVGIGVLAFSGAGTYAAYQLSIPPYVATEPGLERIREPIPVNYRTDAGRRIDCLAYLEFRDVTAAQRQRLNAMSTTGNWSGYGQRIYDQLPEANRQVQDGPEPMLADRVDADLYARALKAVPGVGFRTGDGTPSIEGATIRCTYPDGIR
jgi:hypothetical protein